MAPPITFKAQLACDGCSGAINRIFTKVDGVDSVEFSGVGGEGDQIHTITVNVSKDGLEKELFEKLKKWGENAQKTVLEG